MAPRNLGPVAQSFRRDEDGHRYYEVVYHVKTDSVLDGPEVILSAWPLNAVGSTYVLDNDADPWAFCTPQLNIAAHKDVTDNDPLQDWLITQYWTTKPTWRCQTLPIENPLLEPFQLSGDFASEQRQASVDRFGDPLQHPNFQPIIGPQAEHKYSWPTISITFNSATLPLSTYVLLVNKVNDAVLWGLPVRTIRFIDARWERLTYGTCFYYFRTTYTFEFDLDTFDKPIPAEGTIALIDGGDSANPADYGLIYDTNSDENIAAPLDGEGRRVTAELGNTQFIQRPQIADQGNLLLLGIPSTLL